MTVWPYNAKFAVVTPVIATVAFLLGGAAADAKTWRVNNVDRSVSIHLRQLPNNRSKVIAYIPVEATGLTGGLCNDRWCEIEYKGNKGWVFRKYLIDDSTSAASASANTAPNTAETSSTISKPDGEPEATASLPAPPPPAKEVPVKRGDGPPIAVYAFPSDKLPVAGHLAPDTATVQSLGACIRNWCYIRSGSLVGWLQQDRFVTAPAAATASAETTQSIAKEEPPAAVTAPAPAPAREAKEEPPALNNTESTATQTVLENPVAPETAKSGGTKLYALAGLSSGASLTVRQQPGDDTPVLGSIPANARDIEGLHKCVTKWCLVRYREITGWVLRRHLADASLEGVQSFLITGVGLLEKLDVVDSPSKDANIVGRIPAYATGIVPIGGCDKSWCHVRYLGVAGWVRTEYLAPSEQ